jgi:hypothetical protein
MQTLSVKLSPLALQVGGMVVEEMLGIEGNRRNYPIFIISPLSLDVNPMSFDYSLHWTVFQISLNFWLKNSVHTSFPLRFISFPRSGVGTQFGDAPASQVYAQDSTLVSISSTRSVGEVRSHAEHGNEYKCLAQKFRTLLFIFNFLE